MAEEINWQVVSGGGTEGADTEYILNGTIGQTATGVSNHETEALHHGFWQYLPYFPNYCDECEPGEADGASPINILDIVYLINYKYKEGPAPTPYELCNGDAVCDCVVNILDVVHLINYKYKDGPPPCSCEEWGIECGLPLRE